MDYKGVYRFRDWILSTFGGDSLQVRKVHKELSFLKILTISLCQYIDLDGDSSSTKEIATVDHLVGILNNIQKTLHTYSYDRDQQCFDMFVEKLHFFKPILKEIAFDLSYFLLRSICLSEQDLKELLDIAIKNLKDLLVLKPDIISPLIKQIGAFQKRLEFVSAILHFASIDIQPVDDDKLNSFFNHIKDLANRALGVPFLYWVDERDERLNTMVSQLIDKFKPCTIELAELYLGTLKALKPSVGPDFDPKRKAVGRFLEIIMEDLLLPTDDGFEILQHGLTFIISFLVNPPEDYDEEKKLVPALSNVSIEEIAFVICSLYVSNNLKEELTEGSNYLFHDLIEKINQAKSEIGEFHFHLPAPSWNNFPRTNVLGFLDFLLEDLKEGQKCMTCLTIYQRNQIMILQEELLSLKPLLCGVFKLQDEDEELKHLRARISRMAYRLDYAIDSCFFFDPTNYWNSVMCLSSVTEEIQLLKIELNKSRYVHFCNTKVLDKNKHSKSFLTPKANNTVVEDVMVGFADEKEKIIDCLTGGLPQLGIVAIVGMGGQGKTTLAKKVYQEPRVRLHFKKYAWHCISQEYKIEEILIRILKEVNPTLDEHDISHESHGDLAERLYRCLKGNNYLIVLDDIWDTGAWKELKEAFPDDKNGSRIILTSRIREVVLEAKHYGTIHELHPLSFEDSWKLLKLKLSYDDGTFPQILLDTGKQIAKNCKGLPLAIVVIAGVLANQDTNLAFWKQVSESLKSQVPREGCMDILELSYKHLPDYLKPCFLYLAAFREDEPIIAKRLIQYWIADRLVWKHENRSLEDIANEYLKELVGRSLLFVAKRSSRFGIKKCVVHDLVRELCLEKSKEENFLLAPYLSCDHSFDKINQQYRLCFHTKVLPSFESKPLVSTVRTLLFSELVEYPCVPFFFIQFKFLRVLDLICVRLDSGIEDIMEMVQLRYLALWGEFCVPLSIVNLSRLEFLLLYVAEFQLPNAIWSMRSLRHLYLSKRPFKDTDDLDKDSFQLDNLESFVSYRCCSEEEFKWQLRMMPNVRKLAVRLNYCIKLSNFLNRLESLTLLMGNLKLSATEFDLPPTLRKLTLGGSILLASIVSTIGNLPNLEVLKLLTSLEGKTWDVEDNEFLNLKYLKLARSDIEEWNVSPNAFPNLQQLIFKQCHFLTEIPVRFGTLLTLKVIKVLNSSNLADSVHEIIAEQQELGDTNLQIITDFSDSEVDC